jgi:hypothetical protein
MSISCQMPPNGRDLEVDVGRLNLALKDIWVVQATKKIRRYPRGHITSVEYSTRPSNPEPDELAASSPHWHDMTLLKFAEDSSDRDHPRR